jgi:L-alanine-DL-glutamate epimerase-like enolase superfamily enzyme
VKLEAFVRHVRWRSPLRAAHATDTRAAPPPRPLVLVRLESADGAVGYGEAAPLADYDGVTLEQVSDALRAYEPVCATGAGLSHAELLANCAARAPLPQALAAIDLALWDLAGQRAGQPIWQLLGSQAPPIVELNAAIGAEDPGRAGSRALEAVERGLECIKVKVGVGDDVARVRAVRSAVGPRVRLRLDANGAWLLDQAIETLRTLVELDIELCEEPVHGVFGIAAVARALPYLTIAADETGADPTLFKARVCGSVCLKISRCGGITGVLRDAVAARNAGYDVYLASTLDGPLGIAAALHVAAVVEPVRACGLATLDRFVAPEVLPISGGRLAPPPGSGLGDRLAGWYDSL